MPSCAVVSCKTYTRITKGLNIKYHHFPRSPEYQKIWVKKCERKDKINVKFARVCSQHFKDTDYIRDLKNELLGLPIKKLLKPDAVPSLNLPSSTAEEKFNEACEALCSLSQGPNASKSPSSSSSRGNRCNKRAVRKRALETLAKLPLKEFADKETATDECACINPKDLKKMRNWISYSEFKIERINVSYKKLVARNQNLRTQLRQAKEKLRERSKSIETKVENKIKSTLQKAFTKNQIKCLLSGQNRITWNSEDVAKAIELRAVSRCAYTYLRKNGFPLPSLSTVKKWNRKTRVQSTETNGILQNGNDLSQMPVAKVVEVQTT